MVGEKLIRPGDDHLIGTWEPLTFGKSLPRINHHHPIVQDFGEGRERGGNLAGPARPRFQFNDRDYWLQGINYGMNWDF